MIISGKRIGKTKKSKEIIAEAIVSGEHVHSSSIGEEVCLTNHCQPQELLLSPVDKGKQSEIVNKDFMEKSNAN